MTADNTYTDGTTISAGTLQLGQESEGENREVVKQIGAPLSS
ncbi:hypothetical protein DUT91_14850 [Phyllobacterium salinisoli]|uniref:Uncharacterized protein n=1 Tax=Phyllobacterium salinisoli TaxID=1899321 RepID=A0A368K0Y5_9HYPH|nr:hypothetical protein DUT91_14850 [Phyllobacterium salinisoli]